MTAPPGNLSTDPVLARDVRWLPHVAPPEALPDGRRRIAWIYFGSPAIRPPAADALGGAPSAGGYAWTGGMLRLRTAVAVMPFDLASPVEGHDVQFQAAVWPDTTPWAAILTLGSPTRRAGPVSIEIDGGFAGEGRPRWWDGRVIARNLTTEAKEFKDLHFELTPREGRIGIRLDADSCALFAANSLALYAPAGSRIPVHLDPAPQFGSLDTPLTDLPALTPAERLKRLTEMVNWIHATAPRDGGFSYEGSWYQNAYSIRAGLAAAALEAPFLVTGAPDARVAVRRTVLAFLAGQHPDGGFPSRYFGPLECPEAMADTSSRNLADVGSMAHALLLAVSEFDDSTRARGVAAARRYADQVVLPRQLPSGAFPNLRYEGENYPHPYSVATGTQAAHLAVLGAMTGERRYRDGAYRAARFLAWSIRKDGSVNFYPYNADSTIVRPATAMGDTYYMLEGLIWAWTYARNDREQRLFRDAVGRYLFGPAGLHASRARSGAFTPQDPWTNSKMPAMLYILCRARALGLEHPELSPWIEGLTALMGDPLRARNYGVMVDPIANGGSFGLIATGFAGVGMAAATDATLLVPPVVVLKEIKPKIVKSKKGKAAKSKAIRRKKKRRN